jgi:hypothetical protein
MWLRFGGYGFCLLKSKAVSSVPGGMEGAGAERPAYHIMTGNNLPCIAANLAANVSVGSKMRRTQREQI